MARQEWDYPPSGGQIEDPIVRQVLEGLRGLDTPPISLSQTLAVTGATTLSSLTASGNVTVGGALAVTGNLSVQGNSTLGNAGGDSVTVTGSLTQSGGAWSLSSPTTGALTTTGNRTDTVGGTFGLTATGAGALVASAWTVTGATKFNSALKALANLTITNALETLTRLFVDSTNGRTIVGSDTALTSAADDVFTVVGGMAHFAGNSGPSIGLRYNAAQTVGWTVGVSAAGANPDLVFKDDATTEVFRIGDGAASVQAKVTGTLDVTSDVVARGRLVVAGTTFSGTEELRVVGQSRLEGDTTITGGSLVMATGTITLANNQGIKFTDSGGTVRDSAIMNASDVTIFGHSGNAGTVVRGGYVRLQYGTTTRLEVNSDGIGLYGVSPVARPAAYTHTYSTATRTHATFTAGALSISVGSADNTLVDVGAAFNSTILNNNFADVGTQINNILTDLANTKQVLNQVIDDLQSLGALQ